MTQGSSPNKEIAANRQESILTPDQILRGGAWGFAFAARMMGDDPRLSEETRKAYRWAESEFLRIAQAKITEDEAVAGYGA